MKLTSNVQLKQIIDSIPVGFHNYRLENNKLIFVDFNPAAEKLFKIDLGHLIGKEFTEAFPYFINTNIPEKFKEIIQTGSCWTAGIIEYKNKEYFRISAFKTHEDNMTVIFENITQQIIAETKYKKLIEAIGAGVYSIDLKNGKFTFVNDTMCRQTGWTKEELIEMGPAGLLTENSLLEWTARWNKFNKGEYEFGSSFEYEVKTKAGGTLWALIVPEFLPDENGKIISANIVAIDITKQKRIEKELKDKEKQVFHILESKIKKWKTEMDIKNRKRNKQLNYINGQIESMTGIQLQTMKEYDIGI